MNKLRCRSYAYVSANVGKRCKSSGTAVIRCAKCRGHASDPSEASSSWLRVPWSSAALATLAAVAVLRASPACGALTSVTRDIPWADEARIVTSPAKRDSITRTLVDLERDTGYRVRILTKVQYSKADLDAARAAWGVDKTTVLLVFDPTSPNIFGYDYIGDDILLGPLRRPFWIELQSRFGNIFYVRDNAPLQRALSGVVTHVSCAGLDTHHWGSNCQWDTHWQLLAEWHGQCPLEAGHSRGCRGDAARSIERLQGEARALQAVVDTVDSCLRQSGCKRVPGLPDEQFYFTTILAIAGGVVLGFSTRFEPNAIITKRWIWPVLLSPLWASLFFSFGIGPVISRTDSLEPVAINTAAFVIAALLFRPRPIFYKEQNELDQ